MITRSRGERQPRRRAGLGDLRPRYLLAGKVLGIGLLGLSQVAIIGGTRFDPARAFDAPDSLASSPALIIPWFALGFPMYAVAYAAAGALASRTQDANSAGIVVTYSLFTAYFLGYVALASNKDGLLANLLTIFPPTAPLVLAARSAFVRVPLWQHGLAAVLVLATIHLLARPAGRIYAHGLLRSGPRIGIRGAWRLHHARSH